MGFAYCLWRPPCGFFSTSGLNLSQILGRALTPLGSRFILPGDRQKESSLYISGKDGRQVSRRARWLIMNELGLEPPSVSQVHRLNCQQGFTGLGIDTSFLFGCPRYLPTLFPPLYSQPSVPGSFVPVFLCLQTHCVSSESSTPVVHTSPRTWGLSLPITVFLGLSMQPKPCLFARPPAAVDSWL